MDSDNEGVENKVLPPDRKWYSLRNLPNVNYSDKRATRCSMGWNNLIVGSNEIHNISKAYVNVVNDISTSVKPTPPTNTITNENVLTQYSTNQGLKIFEKKARLQYKNNYSSFIIAWLLNLRNPKTSVMDSGEGVWHI